MDSQTFEKIKSYLRLCACKDAVIEHSTYACGNGIDLLIQADKSVGLIDNRMNEESYVIVGICTDEQMNELMEIATQKMQNRVNELLSCLPV